MAIEDTQISVSYKTEEDRLLLRVKLDGHDTRMWLTRRMTASLFASVEKLFDYLAGTQTQPKEQRRAVSSFMQENAVQQGDFTRQYKDEGLPPYPAGGPLLVSKLDFKSLDDGRVKIVFSGPSAAPVAFKMKQEDVRAVFHMLVQAAQKAGWDLPVPQVAQVGANAAVLH